MYGQFTNYCAKHNIHDYVNDLLIGGGVEKLMYDLTWAMHDKYDITIMTDEKSDRFNGIKK